LARRKQPVTELWQTTQNWLLQLGNKPNTNFCREEISTHPEYPAITAVIDFLDSGNMRYQAVQADATYIHEFNYPLLAHIRQPGQEFMYIIPSAAEWDKQTEITQHWSGVAIFPEKNSQWQNGQNSICQKESFKNKTFAGLLLTIGLALLILTGNGKTTASLLIFGCLSLLGLIVSIVLLGTELGYQNQVVKQVCGAVSSGGCEKVLKSKYAKGILGITPADASLIYFSTQFIFYLLNLYLAHHHTCIFILAVAGIAIAALSIFTQAAILKQWCALCLGIVAALISQGILAFILLDKDWKLLSINLITQFLLYAILCCFLYFIFSPLKELLKAVSLSRQKLAELKKWKTDINIFKSLLHQEQQVDISIWANDIILGNAVAPVTITVACNLYCGPCAKTHDQLDNLLHRFAGIVKVQVRLLYNTRDDTDKLTIASLAILQKTGALESNSDLKQMFTDWFEWMDVDKWETKWLPDKTINIKSRLNDHAKWIEQSKIQFTPTLFINGYKLPGRYNLKDLELLIPLLGEILTT